MEIVFGIVIFCVVVYLCYLWASQFNETRKKDVTPTDPQYGLYYNTSNSYQFGGAIQSAVDLSDSTGVSQPSSSDTNRQQDCSTESISDDRSVDCPCPDNATSYDSAGCSVDSSSPDVGNSN